MTTETTNEVTGAQAKELRIDAKMTQKEFWRSLGVTQGAGSRYEADEVEIPKPVQLLMHAMYVNKKAGDAAKVRRAAAKAVKLLGDAINQ